jgi:hypothetical protein
MSWFNQRPPTLVLPVLAVIVAASRFSVVASDTEVGSRY